MVHTGCNHVWVWIAIQPVHKSVLGIHIGTWYPQACNFMHLKHRLHSPIEKSLIERIMQYFKDRTTECFDGYYHFTKKINCDLSYVYNWVKLFTYAYKTKIKNTVPFLNGDK